MSDGRCLRNVPPEDVPPIMRPVTPWRCVRLKGHRGKCVPSEHRLGKLPKPWNAVCFK